MVVDGWLSFWAILVTGCMPRRGRWRLVRRLGKIESLRDRGRSVRRQIGKGGDQLIPVYVSWWKRRQVEEPLKQFRKLIFQQDYLPRVEALPGARDLLVRVKEAGIRVALASSADKDEMQIYKKIVGMEELVEKETSANDADRSKPHPDIFTAALKRLKLPAKKAAWRWETLPMMRRRQAWRGW